MPDIMYYTLTQVRGFLRAVAQQEAAHDARLLSLIAIGTRGDPENLERTRNKLTTASSCR